MTRQLNSLRALEPGRGQPLALLERAQHAVGEVLLVDEDRGVAGDLAQRRLVEGDDRRAARHRLEHGQAEALEAGRLDETGGAAVEVGELLLVDVAAQVGARRAELAASASSLTGPATTSGRGTAAAAASAASWFFRGWTAPTTSTYVPSVSGLPGVKAGSTPFGVTTTFAGGRP